jgi:tight adherence protein C
MYDLVIPILSFVAATAIGAAVLTARHARLEPVRARLGNLIGDGDSSSTSTDSWFRRFAERLVTMAALGRPSARLQEELARAGYYAKNTAATYLGFKALLFVIGLIGFTAIIIHIDVSTPARIMLVATGATMLSAIPNLAVRLRRARRAEDVRLHLPDTLDLLEICVSSGMGLDMAWNSVAEEMRDVSSTLSDEIALTNTELHLGAPRADAMRRMAQRTGAQEVSSLVAVLVQSERFGTSIAGALRTFSESMRERRSQQAAENAEKMAVKLLFPMVLFIFPTILVVSVGPACVVLADIMGW